MAAAAETKTPAAASLLTAETVPAYLAKTGVLGPSDAVTAKAIVGGNVNYAFQATDAESGKSVFVKQAPEFVAIFGPDGLPLTSARMQQEVDAYAEWRGILGDAAQKRFLPQIHHFDGASMVIVMEFLGDSELMERGLVDTGIVSPKVLPELLNIIILHLVASVAIWRPRRGTSIYDVRSGLERGSPKNRQKEQNQLISDSDKGVKKSEKFADVICGSPLEEKFGAPRLSDGSISI